MMPPLTYGSSAGETKKRYIEKRTSTRQNFYQLFQLSGQLEKSLDKAVRGLGLVASCLQTSVDTFEVQYSSAESYACQKWMQDCAAFLRWSKICAEDESTSSQAIHIELWVEWVNTDANIADLPSRALSGRRELAKIHPPLVERPMIFITENEINDPALSFQKWRTV